MSKPELSLDTVRTLLQERLFKGTVYLEPVTEGEESQAFSFTYEGKAYIIRINPSSEGFQKDAYAYDRFNSPTIPIPRVIQIGYVDRHHAYCVSEKMPGITLQDLEAAEIEPTLQPTLDVWSAISNVNIDDTTGFGDFDSAGKGRFQSWHEYLLSILDPKYYDWGKVIKQCDEGVIRTLIYEFQALIPACPEERRLVHGDFGSNNVLTDGEQITAVLDWESAKYGDPLFDIAGSYFWSTWLQCMQAFAAYCKEHLGGLPNYKERISCYQLRCGLDEIYAHALAGDRAWTEWAQKHSMEVLSGIS